MLKPERLLGLLLQKARDEWEEQIRSMRADTAEMREAFRVSEERHAQHEADLFRQAQVGHASTYNPKSAVGCARLNAGLVRATCLCRN